VDVGGAAFDRQVKTVTFNTGGTGGPLSPRQRAISLIARYDQPGADECDRRVVGIAKAWISLLGKTHGIRGRARRMLDELAHPPPSRSCGWDELREAFANWAVEQEIIGPAEVPRPGQ
jgi:hypothetical protein